VDFIVASTFVFGSLRLTAPLLETKALVKALGFGCIFADAKIDEIDARPAARNIDGRSHECSPQALATVIRLDEDSPQPGAVSEFRAFISHDGSGCNQMRTSVCFLGTAGMLIEQICGFDREDRVLLLGKKVCESSRVESEIIVRAGGKGPRRLREHSQAQPRISRGVGRTQADWLREHCLNGNVNARLTLWRIDTSLACGFT
jgi:hypothetical protein